MILFDGYFREKEIDIFFAVNPKSDVAQNLIYSRSLPNGEPFTETAATNGTNKVVPTKIIESLRIEDALIGIQFKHNFNIMEEKSTRVNLIIQDCEDNDIIEEKCLDLVVEARQQNKTNTSGEVVQLHEIFPSKMRLRLKSASLSDYMANISNYSFMTTMVIILSFFTMLSVIKQVAENHALAQSLSPITIGVNLIWNFFFFAIHFQFSIQGEGEFMQYLGLPAFWFFISSFTFESRLFILVWRAQLD